MKLLLLGIVFAALTLAPCAAEDSVTLLSSGSARLSLNGSATVYQATQFKRKVLGAQTVYAFFKAGQGKDPIIVLEKKSGSLTILPFNPRYETDFTSVETIRKLSGEYVAIVFDDTPQVSLYGVIDLTTTSIHYYYGSDVAANRGTVVVVDFRFNPTNPASPCYVYVDNQFVTAIPIPRSGSPFVKNLDASTRTVTIGNHDDSRSIFAVKY